MSKFPVLSISLFSAESGQHSNKKVPCFTNKVLEWYKREFQFTIFLDDKIRATVQLITYTVPQNCLSIFPIHHNSQFTFKTVLPLSVLAQRLSFRFFFLEGHHLSKIRLGANVTKRDKLIYYLASFGVEFHSFLLLLLYRPPVTVANNNLQPLVHPLTLSFIPIMMMLNNSQIQISRWITL